MENKRTMMNIKDEYLEALSKVEVTEDGELIGLEAVEDLKGEFVEKAEAVALYILEKEARAKAIKDRAKENMERAKAEEKQAEKLREYLAYNLMQAEIPKLETEEVKLSFRKSEVVEIPDEFAIAESFMRTKVTKEPDKALIKKLLKDGVVVEGATLRVNSNLQIK